MFARRLSAAFVAPATLVLRNVALAAGEDVSKPTTATTTPDNIVHQPSFGAMNTRSVPKKTNSTPRVTLDSLTLISGSAHKELATAISKEINVPLCDATVKRFADGEVAIQINDNIRGQDVFIVQTCAAPVNDSIIELLLTISCARRSNVQRITAVVPYFGYKHHRRGNAISTKHNSRFLWSGVGDFAAMLQEMGVDRVITVDLQRPGQGLESSFFDNAVPVETLLSTDLFVHHLTNEMQLNEPVTIVAPNAECYHKARKFQTELQRKLKKEVKFVTYFSVDSGSGPTDATQLKTMGNKKLEIGSGDVIIVDDMVDTGVTIQSLSGQIKAEGAQNIYICASHGLFTENAIDIINRSPVTKVIVTDSLPLPTQATTKIEQVSVAKFLANVILTEHFRSVLFADEVFEDE